MIGRIYNNYIKAIQEQVLLPKAVIFVIEEDLLKAADHYKKGTSSYLKPCIEWLVSNVFNITDTYKQSLPTKSRKFKYPSYFWVPAVFHNAFASGNLYRDKFNVCLSEVVKKQQGMKVLDLFTWNRHDLMLCSHGVLNATGFKKLWNAINDAYQAWDKEQMKKAQSSFRSYKPPENDRFHWSRNNTSSRRRLPKPPPK